MSMSSVWRAPVVTMNQARLENSAHASLYRPGFIACLLLSLIGPVQLQAANPANSSTVDITVAPAPAVNDTAAAPAETPKPSGGATGIALLAVSIVLLLVAIGKVCVDMKMAGGGGKAADAEGDPNPITKDESQAIMDTWKGNASKSLFMNKEK